MPLYETVFQEKPAIVLEIGSAYSKIGFAGEPTPRYILTTEIESFKDILSHKDDSVLYDQTVAFFMKIFFKYLLVSPKDRKLSVVESVLCPTLVRECIARVLFVHFEVSTVLFIPIHLVALASLAVDTAIVVDLGYKEATVIPVYCGVQVLNAWQAQPLAAETVHDEIKANLILNGVNEEILSERIVEDIKVRTCFITTAPRAQAYKNNEPQQHCTDVDYPVDGGDVIKIPGLLREIAFESIFPEDNDRMGLPYIILDSILKCPIDMRKELAENILLIGGTAMTIGLTARLKTELLKLINSDLYKDKIFIQQVKFHTAPAKANFTAWLGASIYSATDLLVSRSITRETYFRNSKIPDWVRVEESRSHA